MEKLIENDEEILYVNKNNPFGLERIREITKNMKGNFEEDDDGYHDNREKNNRTLFNIKMNRIFFSKTKRR